MKQPNVQQFKRWAQQHAGLAHAVCMAQAFAQCEQERVAAYVLPIFKGFGFKYAEKYADCAELRGYIADPKSLYLCDDEAECTRYYEACDEAHRAHGFEGEKGYCPALVADDLRRKAEHALLASAGELFGVDFTTSTLEIRADALKLMLGACLKATDRLAA